MPERMQCDALEACMLDHLAPRTVEIAAGRIGLIAGDHVVAEPDLRQLLEYGECRGIEPDRSRASLAVRQHKQRTLEIDVVPTEREDFVEPTAGEQQQSNRAGGIRRNPSPSISRNVLAGGLAVVDLERKAFGLAAPERFAKPCDFVLGQIARARLLAKVSDITGRIGAARDFTGSPRPVVQ